MTWQARRSMTLDRGKGDDPLEPPMTASKRRSGNPAKPPKAVYRPTVWHRNHRYALFGIVGATALTLLAGFLGPSAVTLTLGPRDSYLPPWYLPAGIVKPNEWFVSALIWAAIIVGAIGLWVGHAGAGRRLETQGAQGLRARRRPQPADHQRAADDLGRRADVRRVRPAAGDRA